MRYLALLLLVGCAQQEYVQAPTGPEVIYVERIVEKEHVKVVKASCPEPEEVEVPLCITAGWHRIHGLTCIARMCP